jgi:hypothetical protein
VHGQIEIKSHAARKQTLGQAELKSGNCMLMIHAAQPRMCRRIRVLIGRIEIEMQIVHVCISATELHDDV